MPSFSRLSPGALAVVGNAPEMGDRAAEIDACDTVIRFNNAAGFGACAGRRTTHLALVNRGGQPREWVEERFASLSALDGAGEVILPFPQLFGAPSGVCWTQEMTLALAPFGVRVRTLDSALHEGARRALTACGAGGKPNPSTGFLVVYHLLRHLRPGLRPQIFGFGFEGWEGHPWDAERRWFHREEALGRLVLHPLRTPS